MLRRLYQKTIDGFIVLGQNQALMAIRDGLSFTVPFTIVGSLFMILANFPLAYVSNWFVSVKPQMDAVVNMTFGNIGLISTIGIAYHRAKQMKVSELAAVLLSVVSLFLVNLDDSMVLIPGNLGATGIFTGLILALFIVSVLKFFEGKKLMKGFKNVPDNVLSSFEMILPTLLIITLILFVRYTLHIDLNEIVAWVVRPLFLGLDSILGLIVYTLLVCLLWSVGIHGSHALSGIATGIFMTYLSENILAFNNGLAIPHIVADGYWTLFMSLGGTGATLGLVIVMLTSRDKTHRSLGRLSLTPAIFCINEPVIFGFPIVMNPLMLIPFIMTPIILGVGTYILMSIGWIHKIVFLLPWTTPPIIGPYLATGGDWRAAVWSVVSILISYLIYLPFFKLNVRNELKRETLEL